MPRGRPSHTPGEGDTPEGGGRRIHSGRAASSHHDEGMAATKLEATAGRAGSSRVTGKPAGAQRPDSPVTHGTGERGGTPDGPLALLSPNDKDPHNKRGVDRENEIAAAMAANGYRIKQKPTAEEVKLARQATGDTGNSGRNPDYLVEGKVFEGYSPKDTKDPRGVWREAEIKVVEKGQSQRLLVHLNKWQGDMTALLKQFEDWPIAGLKELKAYGPDGDIIQIIPPPATDGE